MRGEAGWKTGADDDATFGSQARNSLQSVSCELSVDDVATFEPAVSRVSCSLRRGSSRIWAVGGKARHFFFPLWEKDTFFCDLEKRNQPENQRITSAGCSLKEREKSRFSCSIKKKIVVKNFTTVGKICSFTS